MICSDFSWSRVDDFDYFFGFFATFLQDCSVVQFQLAAALQSKNEGKTFIEHAFIHVPMNIML
jgi:hypothetical protein